MPAGRPGLTKLPLPVPQEYEAIDGDELDSPSYKLARQMSPSITTAALTTTLQEISTNIAKIQAQLEDLAAKIAKNEERLFDVLIGRKGSQD